MIIIGIDNYERKFKVQKGTEVTALDIPEDLFTRGNYAEIFDKGLEDYTQAYGQLPAEPITLVVPDSLVAMDTITLPTMSKRTMPETFKTEYQNLYKNYTELEMHEAVVNANKKTTSYLVTMVRKDFLQRVKEILAGRNLVLEKAIPAAAARCEALTDQHAKLHKDTYLFLDVQESSSQIILYDKGRLFGFAGLPFGKNALPDDQVVDEYNLYEHDIADLAVINARERAKAAKLTMAAEEENVNVQAITENAEGAPALSKQEIMEMAQSMAEEDPEAEAEEAEAEAEAAAEVQATPQGKRYVKKPRKLPAFMQRPIPETANGMVCENFRAFQVRLLNYVRVCKLNDALPNPEYIVLNLPKEYEFLIQTLNAQEDNGISFRLLCADGHSSVFADLEMFGASKVPSNPKQNIKRQPVYNFSASK